MATKLLLLIVALFGSASALVMSPLAAHAPISRVAASPSMACNGGKGGRGGKSPPKDKARRGKVRRLVWAADSPELVKDILLTSSTEQMLLKMNWKVRKSAMHHVKARAAQFDVDVPAAFAGMDCVKQSTKKHLLTASIKDFTPMHPKAKEALKDVRAC